MLSFWLIIVTLFMIALGLYPSFWAIPLFFFIAFQLLLLRYIARWEGRED